MHGPARCHIPGRSLRLDNHRDTAMGARTDLERRRLRSPPYIGTCQAGSARRGHSSAGGSASRSRRYAAVKGRDDRPRSSGGRQSGGQASWWRMASNKGYMEPRLHHSDGPYAIMSNDMSKRPIEFSDTYTPGKNRGKTRTVTVERIPGIEVSSDGVTDTIMTFEVAERIDRLIKRALRANDHQHQHITYTASKSGRPAGRSATR